MTGVLLRMSREAISWVLRDAPGVPAQCVGVLVGLAEHADKTGHAAYPSAVTLASYSRKSKRQVQYDLALLVDLKLIREGDQSHTAKYPVNRRPMVYDLAMERVAGVQPIAQPGVQPIARVKPVAPQQPIAPQTGDDLQEHDGVQPTAPQESDSLGCNGAQPGVQPTAPKPTTNQEIDGNNNSTRGDSLFGDEFSPAGRKRVTPHANPLARFPEWYESYPLHKARGEAEKAYAATVKAGADPGDLIAGAIRYQRDPKVLRGYIKNPATWLRAKCWEDEPEPEPKIQPERGSRNGFVPKPVNHTPEEYNRGFGRRPNA